MLNPVFVNLEQCPDNEQGSSLFVYTEKPTDVEAMREFIIARPAKWFDNLGLWCDGEDEYFSAVETPTPVSVRAKLYRYDVTPVQ